MIDSVTILEIGNAKTAWAQSGSLIHPITHELFLDFAPKGQVSFQHSSPLLLLSKDGPHLLDFV